MLPLPTHLYIRELVCTYLRGAKAVGGGVAGQGSVHDVPSRTTHVRCDHRASFQRHGSAQQQFWDLLCLNNGSIKSEADFEDALRWGGYGVDRGRDA